MLLVDNQRHLRFAYSSLSSEKYWLKICVISGKFIPSQHHSPTKKEKHFVGPNDTHESGKKRLKQN